MALSPPSRHDIIVQSSDRQFIAIIEIKNVPDLSRDTATLIRRNSMLYSLLPQTPYFLLLSQEVGFLWKDAWQEGPDTPPTYQFAMDKVVTRYLQEQPTKRLYEMELEFLVLRWLNDITEGKRTTNEEPERTLAQAGLVQLMKEANVTLGVDE